MIRYNCIFVEVAAEDGGDDADDDSDDDNSSTQSAAGESNGGEDAAAAAEPEFEEAEPAEKAPAQAQAPFKRVLPERRREPSKVLRDSYALLGKVDTSQDEPATLGEALVREDGALWGDAADDEMQSLWKNGVIEPVDDPGEQLIQSKWVNKIKRTVTGEIERYKCRLVAKGFKQRAGIDYEETFAPVARHATMRALLALAAVEDLEVEQIDVKTAVPQRATEGGNLHGAAAVLRLRRQGAASEKGSVRAEAGGTGVER